MQTDFLALYRGQTVSEARLVAVTADPVLVTRFIRNLTGEDAEEEPAIGSSHPLRLVTDSDN